MGVSRSHAPDLLRVLRRIKAHGTHETAHRTRQHFGQAFRYAIASGLADTHISASLRAALAPAKKKHFASIRGPKLIRVLLRALDGYSGTEVKRVALKLVPLLMLRRGELRKLEWSERRRVCFARGGQLRDEQRTEAQICNE